MSIGSTVLHPDGTGSIISAKTRKRLRRLSEAETRQIFGDLFIDEAKKAKPFGRKGYMTVTGVDRARGTVTVRAGKQKRAR